MHKQYTEKAKKALQLAETTSKKLKHNYVGTEHLLIGLLRESTGVAAKTLASAGVEEGKLLSLIEDLIAPNTGNQVMDPDYYTPRAKKVIESGRNEAERFKSDTIGTEHLLMGIIKESDCVAVRLLNTLGVNIQKLYVEF